VFTVAALANAGIGFSLAVDNRETLRLAPCDSLADRIRDIFGREFFDSLLEIKSSSPVKGVSVIGYIERPNQSAPTRRDQYIFVNGRAASAPSVAYALREAYPRKQGDVKPAAFIFINLPSSNVDVNVHPMKREVRFRDNAAVKTAIVNAITGAFAAPTPQIRPEMEQCVTAHKEDTSPIGLPKRDFGESQATVPRTASDIQSAGQSQSSFFDRTENSAEKQEEEARPIQIEFAVAPDSTDASPWNWFKFLAVTGSGYLLIETDAGIVTIWPKAAQERIAYEKILDSSLSGRPAVIQPLLIPEMVRLSPADFSRIKACIDSVKASGFQLEEFGSDTFKIDGVPQLIGKIPPAGVIMTLAKDLSESGSKRGGMRWKEELIARSIAKSFAGSEIRLIEETAVKLIEELSSCRMPYVCPRGRPTMIFTSTRELSRRFGTE
jgi:DNA mismatch repair protein MutL